MELVNRTRARVLELPMKDRDGRDLAVALVKYTFRRDRTGAMILDRETPSPLHLIDVPWDESAPLGSARRPSQAFDEKPGTEVLLVGHAGVRASASFSDVRLRVGPIDKIVRAHGLRVWQRGTFGGVSPGPALPLREPVPLRWELAWGGTDESDPARAVSEPQNPLGRGVARDPASLLDRAAAQLEIPDSPAGSRGHIPAGFGPTARHWRPRVGYAGTYDQAWQETRMPLLPVDFDPRFHVSAPPDQWSPRRLGSDVEIDVAGTSLVPGWTFRLPRIAVTATTRATDGTETREAALDTILIDADELIVELTFRAALPMPAKRDAVEELRLVERWGAS